MNQLTTFILKSALCIVGLVVLLLSVFWLPSVAQQFEDMYPEFAHLHYPLLFGIYVSAIPFFLALYQSFRLLIYIDRNVSFSSVSVKSLRTITYCALSIAALYMVGFILLLVEHAGHPGILLMGLVIMFASFVIAVFSAVLEKVLKNAIAIQTENDLTV